MKSDYPKIALQGMDGLMFVREDEVMYAIADGNYTFIHLTNNRQSKVLRKIKEVEVLLSATKFIRIHRSHLVNLEHIIQLTEGESVVMSDGSSHILARNRKSIFIEKFTQI